MARSRRIARAVLVAAAVLVALELGCGWYARATRSQPLYIPDPLRGWAFQPGWLVRPDGSRLHINSEGLYEEEVPRQKRPGEIRILCLGDSITCGLSLHGQTFPHLLERRLARHYPRRRYRVINGGIPGYNSLQGLILLHELAPLYRPDLLIVTFLNNEHGARPFRPECLEAPLVALRRRLYRSDLYLFLLRAWRDEPTHNRSARSCGPDVPPLEAFGENLDAFARTARRLSIPILFVEEALLIPDPEEWDGRRRLPPFNPGELARYQSVLRQRTRGRGLPLAQIGQAPGFEVIRDRFYLPDDLIHPGEEGNAFMAEVIENTMEKWGLLEPSDRPSGSQRPQRFTRAPRGGGGRLSAPMPSGAYTRNPSTT